MILLGVFFIALTLYASLLNWRGALFNKRWLLRVFVFAVVGPFIANEAGSACVGRQPWIVHPRLMRDASGEIQLDNMGFVAYRMEEGLLVRDAVSESIKGAEVLVSIIMFAIIYSLLFAVWLYVLNDKIQKGPKPVEVLGGPPIPGWIAATAGRALHEDTMSEAKTEGSRP